MFVFPSHDIYPHSCGNSQEIPHEQEIQIPFQIDSVLARMSAATAVLYWTGVYVGVVRSM